METAVSGQGLPIVLIGGGLQGSESWGPCFHVSRQPAAVIRLQNLNVTFGLKGQDLPPGYSVRTESAAVKSSLDDLALHAPVDSIGWSSGGAIALDFALSNPERIKSLTPIEPAAFWALTPDDRKDREFARMADLARTLRGQISEEQFEAFMCGNGSFKCTEASPRTSPLWPRLVRWRQALNGLAAYVEHKDSVDRLKRFRKPVLLIAGSESAKFAKTVNESLARQLPLSEVIELPGGHASFLRSTDLFVDTSGSREETWRAARETAMVYVASRKWVSVCSDDLFFDDLADDRLKGLVVGLLLATAGHLGENTEEQYRVADILGMRRLSSRLQVVPVFEDELPLPGTWANALDAIMDLLASCAREDDASNTPTSRPHIAYFARITKSLVDSGETKSSWRVYAARDIERLCIAGDPDDFAADLCRVLLQWAGLANRRDLDELAPIVTQLIGWLNRPEKSGPRLQSARSQRDLLPPQEAPTETHQPADGTTSPTAAGPEEPIPPPLPSPPSPGAPPTPSTPAPPPTGGALQETPEATPPPTSGPDVAPPPVSGGYTTDDRERRLQSLRKRQAEIEAQRKRQSNCSIALSR